MIVKFPGAPIPPLDKVIVTLTSGTEAAHNEIKKPSVAQMANILNRANAILHDKSTTKISNKFSLG
jgi:hypothetical protein